MIEEVFIPPNWVGTTKENLEILDGMLASTANDPEGWRRYLKDTDFDQLLIRLFLALHDNNDREGLRETPKRFCKFIKEFQSQDPLPSFSQFEGEGYDQMIVQSGIPFYSLCEHHLAPFYGTASVGYIPNGPIVGLSKLARTVRHFAGNFQNQERITSQIADKLHEALSPLGVIVVIKAEHLCMNMRGVRVHGTETTTSKVLGAFKDNHSARAEFFNLLNSSI